MKRRIRLIFSVLSATAALGCVAAAAEPRATSPGAPRKVASVEGITEYRLDNGLRVLLFPDPTRPKVTVNLTVLVGSRHEGYGETGMAHLLEHMVFKGTPTHPDIPGAMKERGAQFNGSTWLDRTNYFETLPASDENLEFAIRLEADRMVNSPIKAEDLATEFSVVRNEFEIGENSPERVLSQRMAAVAYEWHNYGKSTIGNRSDIERVPVDNLRAFYKKFYQPDNAMLVVAGKFDETEGSRLHRRSTSARSPSPTASCPLTYTEEPPQDGERVVTLRRVGRRRSGRPALSRPGRVARRVSRGRGPGRDPGLRALGPALQGAGRDQEGRQRFGRARRHATIPGSIEIMAEVNTKDPADAGEGARRHVLGARRGGPIGSHPGRSGSRPPEDPQGPRAGRGRPQPHRRRALRVGCARRLAALLPQPRSHRKVTPAQVKEVAEKYLTTSNRTVGFFVPTAKPERTPVPAVPDIAKLVDGYTGRELKSARARPSTSRPWRSRPACSGPSRSRASSWPSCPRRPAASPSSCD